MSKKKKKRNKKYRPPPRIITPLTDIEVSYLGEVALFDLVLDVTQTISLNQGGIDTDGRGIRGMRIFTRQTLLGISFKKILPIPTQYTPADDEFWDICAMASITRNIIEGFLAEYYFGIEELSEEEAELRFFLVQLHHNMEWHRMGKLTDPNDKTLKEGSIIIASQQEKIRKHKYLDRLSTDQKNRVLNWREMYKTKADFENELIVCQNLRRDYQLLSNLVHALPISIERIDNTKGRGLRNDADTNYFLQGVMLSRKYLCASTVYIAEKFKDSLGVKFESEIESIRPLMTKGFD